MTSAKKLLHQNIRNIIEYIYIPSLIILPYSCQESKPYYPSPPLPQTQTQTKTQKIPVRIGLRKSKTWGHDI